MNSYNDHILCMNVDSKKQSESIDAILSAYKTARQQGKEPGLLLLQEFPKRSEILDQLIKELNTTTISRWKYVRQWGAGPTTRRKGKPEAQEKLQQEMAGGSVVLYNESVYEAKALPMGHKPMNHPRADRLPPLEAKEAKSYSFNTRWAGAQLTVKSPNDPLLTFLVVSYHGKQQGFSNAVKLTLSQEFIRGVAHVAENWAIMSMTDGRKNIPVIIAGDWNSSFDAYRQAEMEKILPNWECKPIKPKDALCESVRRGKPAIDYCVTANHKSRSSSSGGTAPLDLEVLESHYIAHSEKHRQGKQKTFDHDPLLITFQVRSREDIQHPGEQLKMRRDPLYQLVEQMVQEALGLRISEPKPRRR